MKIKVEKTALLNALRFCSQASGNRATPICDDVRLQSTDNILVLSATTLSTSAQTTCPIETDIDAPNFDVCVNIIALKDFTSKITDYNLTFTIDDENQTLTVSHSTGHATFPYREGSEFPKTIPQDNVPSPVNIEIPASTLVYILQTAKNFIGSDPLRPTLATINLVAENNSVTYYATDAHKLIKETIENSAIAVFADTPTASIMIPRDCISLVVNIPNIDNASLCSIRAYDDKILIGTQTMQGYYVVAVPKTEGKYPNCDAIVRNAANNDKVYTVHNKSLLQALERALTISDKTSSSVRFDCTTSQITLSSEDFDSNRKQIENLPLLQTANANISFGLNGLYLRHCLSTITSENLSVAASAPNNAISIIDHNNHAQKTVICMPTILNN